MGLRFGGSLPSRTGRRKEQQPPVHREPASRDACILSGFNLLIAAYSYIVNPDLDTAKRLCRGYRHRDTERRRRSFSSAGRLHLKDAPNQCPAFARRGPLTRCKGCVGDRPSRLCHALAPILMSQAVWPPSLAACRKKPRELAFCEHLSWNRELPTRRMHGGFAL
jgi:hypothetical protein